ncbi:thioredoxin family protein [Aliidiomarina sp. Khilg15.8]
MGLGNILTEQLNRIEHFIERSPAYLFPLKALGWIVLLMALMITNLIALGKWPLSAISKKLRKKGTSAGEPVDISSHNELKRVISEQPRVLVDFWAEWCGPCLLMDKSIKQLAREQAGNVTVVKVDVSLNSALSKLYAVRGLPTVIVFHNGEEVSRKSGSLTKSQLEGLIKQ